MVSQSQELNATQNQPLLPEEQKRMETLSREIKKLNSLCNQLDPYLPIPQKLQEELKEFHITDFYDPFTITNKLLVLLEDSIEELHALEKRTE